MVRARQQCLNSNVNTVLSATPESMAPDCSSTSFSLFYTMLPGAVKYRLSTMPSLRKSISTYSLRAPRRSRPPLDTRTRSAESCSLQLYSGAVRPPGHGAAISEAGFGSGEVGTGTGWKYANQGQDVLQNINGHFTDGNRPGSSRLSCHRSSIPRPRQSGLCTAIVYTCPWIPP